jgi:hypothetical protein
MTGVEPAFAIPVTAEEVEAPLDYIRIKRWWDSVSKLPPAHVRQLVPDEMQHYRLHLEFELTVLTGYQYCLT